MRKTFLSGLAFVFVFAGLIIVGSSAAAPAVSSVNGQGTVMVPDGNGGFARRTFTVNAKKAADGTVSGKAVLINHAYSGYYNGNQPYMVHIDIRCMQAFGNTVTFGGMPSKSNDPDPVYLDAVFFSVQDNGEPGKGFDKVSDAFFWDDDPDIDGLPGNCVFNGPNAFPLNTIDSGNIQVK